jgi:hypothetical protein
VAGRRADSQPLLDLFKDAWMRSRAAIALLDVARRPADGWQITHRILASR